MSLIQYAVLCQFFIIITSSIYSLYASSFLIFKKPEKKFQTSRTPVVFLYFCFTASSTIFMLIYSGYTVIWWRPEETLYNPNVLYFVSGLPTIYVNLVPVADFYLCLDRCFAFAFPVIYQKRFKFTLATIFFLTDIFILFIYFFITKYFSFFTSETTTTCVYYVCLIWKLNYPLIMSWTKYLFCGLTFSVSIILLGLSFRKKSTQISNKLNKPVIIMCAIHIVFAFAPGIILPILVKVIGPQIPFTEYIGDANLTCVCISNALSVQIYFRAFKKHFLKPTVVSETTF